MVSEELSELVRAQFALPWDGVHGAAHWARVRENGLRLAGRTGANPEVVELFALLHDCRRRTDRQDPGHGRRAAQFATTLRASWIALPDDEFELLLFACEHHTEGWIEAHVTVQTCWDADRLDLGRVGIEPQPSRLCTAAARQPAIIQWALCRSQHRPSPSP
jgi:uncharacterized protein